MARRGKRAVGPEAPVLVGASPDGVQLHAVCTHCGATGMLVGTRLMSFETFAQVHPAYTPEALRGMWNRSRPRTDRRGTQTLPANGFGPAFIQEGPGMKVIIDEAEFFRVLRARARRN